MAAFFDRAKIVEELLNKGAAVNDGQDINEATPLHMAADKGHVQVMKKLLLRGADANATADGYGPVLNSAISSGNQAAVELLVEHGVRLTLDLDRPDLTSPLAEAASLSDSAMFNYLIEKYAETLPAPEFSKALVKAAECGRVEALQTLLDKFEHTPEYFQRALDAAAADGEWEPITILLQRVPDLDCGAAFYEAATTTEDQEELLRTLWTYTGGTISAARLNDSLYAATDKEKTATVKLLLQEFKVDPNATGEE